MASKNSSGESYGKGRTRNFATVVYPESAPLDWRDKLAEFFIPAFISPLHEGDTNPDSTARKEHWHVIIMFDNVKTNEQAKEVFDAIGGVGLERINNLRAYSRYLCHLDTPEKKQYSSNDVQCFYGADYIDIISLPTDELQVIGEIMDYCDDNAVYSYAVLLRYAKHNHPAWFRALAKTSTLVVKEFLKSKAWEEGYNPLDMRNIPLKPQQVVDTETGEVME